MAKRTSKKVITAILADPDFGKISDSKMGTRYGLSAQAVLRLRNKHNVKPFAWDGPHPSRPLIEQDPELSTKSIKYLCKKWQCGSNLIGNIRREQGVVLHVRGWKPRTQLWMGIEKRCKENQALLKTWARL